MIPPKLWPNLCVVAIPAQNEALYIKGCIAALALQRDETGAPIPPGSLEVLVFANNCSDETASIARDAARTSPHKVWVVEAKMPAGQLNAGWARKRAMDLAALRLGKVTPLHGLILTTDADSRVAPTWLAATLREFAKGVDCVAGYVDAIPSEYLALGSAFLARGRLEDTYLRYLAEIKSWCDPRRHDPWPNHGVSSGASLAVTLEAYSVIGGLPPRPVGEDTALTETLERAGFRVRHSMDVCVATSCRVEGRAIGGAADTMRYRHEVPDAPCDDEIEPALHATRRALYKGSLRKHWMNGPKTGTCPAWLVNFGDIESLLDNMRIAPFEQTWDDFCNHSPVLQKRVSLRSSELPRQIAIAKMILRQLRLPVRSSGRKTAPGDKLNHEGLIEPAA